MTKGDRWGSGGGEAIQLSKSDVGGSVRRRTRSDAHSGVRQEVFVAERGILGGKSVIFGGWPKGWPGKELCANDILGSY